jgi:hypothetical protein
MYQSTYNHQSNQCRQLGQSVRTYQMGEFF